MKLQDRIAIITGSGGGFGEGIAKHFAELGARVVVADIRSREAERVAAEIKAAGGRAVAAHIDVTQSAQVARMVALALNTFGKLDILVNNAGTTHKNQPMLDVDEVTFDRVYAVNVKSIYLGAIHAVPVFRRQGSGNIVNVASTAGVRPRPGLTWYNGGRTRCGFHSRQRGQPGDGGDRPARGFSARRRPRARSPEGNQHHSPGTPQPAHRRRESMRLPGQR